MPVLYLIRHAQATGQPAESPLTPEGETQAHLLAERLQHVGIERIIASPFWRAQQTAAPLAARLGLPVELDERLVERVLASGDLPEWRQQLQTTFADLDLRLPGGETSREARSRAMAAVQDALATGHKVIAMVGHGNLLALLLGGFDPSYGFDSWAAMTNPDCFRVTLAADSAKVERISCY